VKIEEGAYVRCICGHSGSGSESDSKSESESKSEIQYKSEGDRTRERMSAYNLGA